MRIAAPIWTTACSRLATRVRSLSIRTKITVTVTVTVTFTENYFIVKNSWAETWGDAGYIYMARNVNSPTGICGIAMEPSYATRETADPPPIPDPTPGPEPEDLPCGCGTDCSSMCQAFGMAACNCDNGDCTCMPANYDEDGNLICC